MPRRHHSIIFLFVLLIGGAGMNYVQAEVYSGTCGAAGNEANVTWEVDTESGVLTIAGTGAMKDYNTTESLTGLKTPWRNYGSYIKTLIIGSGITHVGVTAFSLTCTRIKDVYVSWTGTSIPTANMISLFTVNLHIPCGQSDAYTAKNWTGRYTLKEEIAHGTCGAQGKNLTWTLSCDGTLTISGTGAMVHYWAYEDIPWWNYRGSIQRIVIEEGVTTIGNHAFVQCSNLTSVSLPNTLTAISYLAFGHCIGLPSLTIPSSVTSMADMFIHNTQSLTDVYVSWTGDDVPTMPADIHQFDASHKQLHIPCGQADAYAAKGWNTKFTLEQENTHYTITVESDDPTKGTVDAVKIGD